MRPITLLTACALLLLVPGASEAQQQPSASTAPAARAADLGSIDAIIAALYDVISGPVGQARDWNRFHSLFAPGARLMPTGRRPDGTHVMAVLTPEEYATRVGPQLETAGFTERELARTVDRFGDVAHAFSSYEGLSQRDSTTIRGINSIQLRHDGTRWWVVTVFWQAERPDLPLPAAYEGR